MALVPLLRIEDKSTKFIIAIALSLAIDTALATIMVYTKLWSPLWGLAILIGISMIGAILQIITIYPQERGIANHTDENESVSRI
jgi:uncharacterized membrane protein